MGGSIAETGRGVKGLPGAETGMDRTTEYMEGQGVSSTTGPIAVSPALSPSFTGGDAGATAPLYSLKAAPPRSTLPIQYVLRFSETAY